MTNNQPADKWNERRPTHRLTDWVTTLADRNTTIGDQGSLALLWPFAPLDWPQEFVDARRARLGQLGPLCGHS